MGGFFITYVEAANIPITILGCLTGVDVVVFEELFALTTDVGAFTIFAP
tara:strand:+ start:1077 stop:1223 length:147 start_codon:yes stop_codon:yes gene_type:complete